MKDEKERVANEATFATDKAQQFAVEAEEQAAVAMEQAEQASARAHRRTPS